MALTLAPNDFYEKLEFDKVLAQLQSLCLGELGAERVAALPLSTQIEPIEKQLSEVNEYYQAILNNQRIPLEAYPKLDEVLRMLSIQGYVLPLDGLLAIAKQLHLVQRLFAFFKNRTEEEEEDLRFVHLPDLLRDLEFDEDLLAAINGIVDKEGNIRSDASAELQRIHRLRRSKQQELDNSFRRIVRRYQEKGWLADSTESFRNHRRVLSVPAEHKRQVRGIIHDESSTGRTVYIEPEEVISINNAIFELESEERREIMRLLRELSNLLRPYVPAMEQYQEVLIYFDILQAKAQLAKRLNATRPAVVDYPHLEIKEAYHPLLYLKNKREGKQTVKFDLHLHRPNRMLILSGPNAGGKSITLKTLGLLQLMLQSGMLLPVGEGTRMGLFQQLFADIGDQQSLEDELSTYSSRLRNARHFIEKADANSLVLIDEFGSGTDPKMGGAIAEAILKALNEQEVWGMITTHYSNLKLFAFKNKGLLNGSMIFDKDKLTPTYELKVGKPGSSFAFEIAQQSGLQEEVIRYAKKRLGKEVKNFDELLVGLEREQQEAKELREQLEAREKRLAQIINNYEDMSKQLEHRRMRLKLQEKEQALTDTSQAQDELRRLLRELRKEADAQRAKEKAEEALAAKREEQKEVEAKVGDLKEKIYEQDLQKSKKGSIEEGSHVLFRESGSRGIVERIEGKKATVVIGNMRLEAKLRDLKLIENPIQREKKVSVQTDTLQQQARFESKLDIRGMRYDEALRTTEAFIDKALIANASELRIVHGKGSGALRNAVRKKLREYRQVHNIFHPERHLGGDGVTIAELE